MQRDYNGKNGNTLYETFIFFHEKSKKLEKEADNSFVLLCQSRNMVGQFKTNEFA